MGIIAWCYFGVYSQHKYYTVNAALLRTLPPTLFVQIDILYNPNNAFFLIEYACWHMDGQPIFHMNYAREFGPEKDNFTRAGNVKVHPNRARGMKHSRNECQTFVKGLLIKVKRTGSGIWDKVRIVGLGFSGLHTTGSAIILEPHQINMVLAKPNPIHSYYAYRDEQIDMLKNEKIFATHHCYSPIV